MPDPEDNRGAHAGRNRSASRHLLAVAAFAILTLLVTLPLASHMTDGVLGAGPGDNLSALWNIWWARTAIRGPDAILWTPALFAPMGTSLALHSLSPLESALAAWLPVEPLTAYNSALLFSVFLNFACAYWAGWTVTGNWLAALFAGVTFGASPFLLVRLQGHLNVLSAWGLPLLVVAAVRFEREPEWTSAVMLGATLGVLAYTDYYFAIFGIVMLAVHFSLTRWIIRVRRRETASLGRALPVFIALIVFDALLIAWIQITGGAETTIAGVRLRMTESFNPRVALGFLIVAAVIVWKRPSISLLEREARPLSGGWQLIAIAVATTALLIVPLAVAGVRLWLAGDYESQTYFWRSAPPGIDLATLVLGNPLSAITGPWTTWALERMHIDRVEGTAWAGVLPVALVALAIRRLRSRADVQRYLWIGVLFFVWSLGPYIQIFGRNTGFMLPQTVLHFVPVVANARIPGRAFVVVQLMIAIVGAQFLAALPSAGRTRAVFGVMAITLVLVDYKPAAHPWMSVDRPTVYDELREQPPGIVLEVPFGFRDGFGQRGHLDHRVLLYQTIHEHPLMGGFVARLSSRIKRAYESDPVVGPLLDLSEGKSLTRTSVAPLAPLAPLAQCLSCVVSYVVIDESAASSELQAFVAKSFALQPVARSGQRALYSVLQQ